MATWQEWIERLGTTWESGPWFQRFRGAMGIFTDAHVEGMREAVRSRMLDHSADDALQYAAQDSNLERYPSDTDTTLRARLKRRWRSWRWAGTEAGLVEQLNEFGLVDVHIYDASDWDPGDPDWSRFWVVIDPPHPYSWPKWNQITWNQFNWGLVPTHEDSLRRLVRKWKPAHVRCVLIIIVSEDAPVWNHNMTWNAFTWNDGDGVAAIPG